MSSAEHTSQFSLPCLLPSGPSNHDPTNAARRSPSPALPLIGERVVFVQPNRIECNGVERVDYVETRSASAGIIVDVYAMASGKGSFTPFKVRGAVTLNDGRS